VQLGTLYKIHLLTSKLLPLQVQTYEYLQVRYQRLSSLHM